MNMSTERVLTTAVIVAGILAFKVLKKKGLV
jgi:hypothetical protein